MTATDRDFQKLSARLDALVRELEQERGVAADKAREVVRLLMRLYGEALARMVAGIEREGAETRRRMLDALAADDLVSSLLVLHELHPHDASARITNGLARVSRLCGARVRLVERGPDAIRVAVEDPLNAWSTAGDVRRAIEEVVLAVAPDAGRVLVDGLPEPSEPLVALQRRRPESSQQQPASP